MQLNRGLCLLQLAKAEARQNPGVALSHAERARLAFLSARLYAPQMRRAGICLELTAQCVGELQAAIDAEREAQEQLNAEMEALIERLQSLLEAQKKTATDPAHSKELSRNQEPRNKQAPLPPPADAIQSPRLLAKTQGELHAEGQGIKEMMKAIDQKIAAPQEQGTPETFMVEPLKLMDGALAAQLKAKKLFARRASWPAARGQQQLAERAIEQILEALADDSDQRPKESEDWEKYSEAYEDKYMEDAAKSMSKPEAMKGDLAVGGEMQELPVPNYSVDDILMEERGSLQFRQQKRASANAGKVEKDY